MTIAIDYYSDILCVWAWIAERRQEELARQFGERIEIRQHFVDVFGNTALQIGEKWADRGGFEGFGAHVVEAAAAHAHAPVAADIWRVVRPASSTPAHAVVKAVEIARSAAAAERLARRLREQFFTRQADIGRTDVLLDLVAREGLDAAAVQSALDSGAAIAAVMRDYQQARNQGIRGSPSWVLDGGRQILYGNVGYRILRANTAELLLAPEAEASWC